MLIVAGPASESFAKCVAFVIRPSCRIVDVRKLRSIDLISQRTFCPSAAGGRGHMHRLTVWLLCAHLTQPICTAEPGFTMAAASD